MTKTDYLFSLCFVSIAFLTVVPVFSTDEPDTISFNRDIRPILSDKCFHCHGPNEESREAGLRFDLRDVAYQVIAPGNEIESELIQRILEDDPDARMPPAEINKPLTEREINLLRRWVQEGAKWDDFWAYVAPIRHPIPSPKPGERLPNWIDSFIGARLERNSLTFSPPADRTTLLRRLYFDLIGLPPTPNQVDEFLADHSDKAIESVVDRLLASRHFGERQAIYWLDLVRYADTVGYHGDQDHNISPYRDWVIAAFNQNMPFSQFTRAQLAGDLLPDATLDQKIASGYNRLLQTSHEGGIQPAEYTAIYAADRVRNVSMVWMGATVGCAQCHDHKYDPYTAVDFYSLSAFFADVDDEKHFKVGSNSLPTKRPPEILVLSTDDQSSYVLAKKKTSRAAAIVADLTRRISTLERPDPQAQTQSDASKPSDSIDVKDLDRLKTELEENKKILANEKKRLSEIESRGAWTMITTSLPQPRTTRLFPRGDWLDLSGPIVQPAIPEFMGRLPATADRPTRLDLANWLVDAEHGSGKLTARVLANRYWYLFMGEGISRSLDDFGGQGNPPAFPHLLDNLAMELIDNDWDIKHLIRLIVTSRTYQQSSLESPERRKLDPYNQLFSHQSRFRLPAELVRDNALAISGLLNTDKIGGKSVKPYQPAGYYRHLNFPTRKYTHDADSRQWRRGIYTHWQRQFLHPSMKAFDAPSREECTAVRAKSNTPSSALVLLNDPIYVEAARAFAARVIAESGSAEFDERLRFAFRIALSRNPSTAEIKILKELYQQSHKSFRIDESAAEKLTSIGQSSVPGDIDRIELAAWTTITRIILNLNETMTRN